MNMSKAQAYARVDSYSFTLQAKQLSFSVKPDVPTTAIFGVQPNGITSCRFEEDEDSDVVAIANYNAPAQHVGKVTVAGGVLTRQLARISGAMNGLTFERGGFLGMDEIAKANRCWTAILAPEGKHWVGRGDPEFFVLSPPANEGEKWRVVEKITLSHKEIGKPYRFVASGALLSDGRLLTVEHDSDYNCEFVISTITGSEAVEQSRRALGQFRYGIALANVDGEEQPVTVTAYHSPEPAGVYVGKTRAVTDIFGDSICPLSNGGALVSRRGMESPEADSLEAPGALIYIPPSLFPGLEWVR
ncbi:MAG: hypothetical protein HYS57_01205 [Parcubacteria group bacterium]|nr:hypothetical protein [Parcubacteria group bacterium]